MDSVKLYAQERLDLDDTRAIQSLVYDYVQEALGGILGHMRGVLSIPTITQTENNGAPYITLTPFQFVTSTPVESSAQSISIPSVGVSLNQYKATVVTYNPSEENSIQISIDTVRTYYQDNIDARLWARPIYVDTDTATRMKWDVAQGAEVAFSDETRSSQRVEFVVQKQEPSYATGEAKWAPIARITAWSDADNTDSLATWQIISAYDHDTNRHFMGSLSGTGTTLTRDQASNEGIVRAIPYIYPVESGRSYRGFGLADQVAMLRYKVAQMQGYGINDPTATPTTRDWYNAPLISLNGIHTAHSVRTSQIVPIASVQIKAQYVDTSGDYEYLITDGTYRVGVQAVRASTVRDNRVSIEFTSALLAEDWYVRHVSCTQLLHREGSNNQFDYNRVNFQVERWASKLTDTAQYQLDDYSTTSGRGITVELLPLYSATEEAISDQHNHVNYIVTESTNNNQIVYFSVVVFASHEDQY